MSYYIVGDKYQAFKAHKRVITYSDFQALLNSSDVDPVAIKNTLVGQGVNDSEREQLFMLMQHKNDSPASAVALKRADRRLTHKHKNENILITCPEKLDDQTYLSHLAIDDDSAQLSDHVTGQHIQGMVLIEAARQMTLAVTEQYFIEENEGIGFATDSLETTFHRYTFPCDVQMYYTVLSHRQGFHKNAKYKVKITFVQNDFVCAEMIYGFSTYQQKFIQGQERKQAEEVLSIQPISNSNLKKTA
ncbi:MAG: AfsA-related hotdog domain-containing protein [Pseudomonadota bacterium]